MTIPGGWELILVAILIMVLFGYKRLPDATRSLGRSMRIFKSETKGLRDDSDDDTGDAKTTSDTTVTAHPLPPVTPPITQPAAEARPVDAEQPHLRQP
jgi:sec-independent protein translocase protein TatA